MEQDARCRTKGRIIILVTPYCGLLWQVTKMRNYDCHSGRQKSLTHFLPRRNILQWATNSLLSRIHDHTHTHTPHPHTPHTHTHHTPHTPHNTHHTHTPYHTHTHHTHTNTHTHTHTPRSVVHLWTSDQFVAKAST